MFWHFVVIWYNFRIAHWIIFVVSLEGDNINKPVNEYPQISNVSRTLVGIKFFDHSDVVGASPVGAAPTPFSFST